MIIGLLFAVFGAQMTAVSIAGVDTPPEKQCSDGRDNDGDGATDYPDDPGCGSARDNSEDSDGEPAPEPTPDPTPEPTPDPTPDPTPEPTPEPTPDPIPEPTPDPTPEPAPAPAPAPTTPPATEPSAPAAPAPAPAESFESTGPPAAAGTEASVDSSSPLPLPARVRLSGRLTATGARITRLRVRAPRGSIVRFRCRGSRCAIRRKRYVVGWSATRVRPAQRAYPAGVVLEVFVSAPNRLGKYTRFRIRRGRAPGRQDACVTPEAGRLPVRIACD